MLRHVSALEQPAIPGYYALDVRWGWRPSDRLELSLAAQNLLDRRHPEFGTGTVPMRSEIGRALYLKASWKL